MKTDKERFAESLSTFIDSINRPKAQILRERDIPQTTYNNWVKKHNPSIPGCVHFKELVSTLNPPTKLIDLWRKAAKDSEIRLFDNIYDAGIEGSKAYEAEEPNAEYNASPKDAAGKKPGKNMHIPLTATVKEIRTANETAVVKEYNFPYKKIGGKEYKAVKVENDALAPIAYRGQHMILSEKEIINNGDLTMVNLNDGTILFKRYYQRKKGSIELESLMPSSFKPTIKVSANDIKDIYKIVGIFF